MPRAAKGKKKVANPKDIPAMEARTRYAPFMAFAAHGVTASVDKKHYNQRVTAVRKFWEYITLAFEVAAAEGIGLNCGTFIGRQVDGQTGKVRLVHLSTAQPDKDAMAMAEYFMSCDVAVPPLQNDVLQFISRLDPSTINAGLQRWIQDTNHNLRKRIDYCAEVKCVWPWAYLCAAGRPTAKLQAAAFCEAHGDADPIVDTSVTYAPTNDVGQFDESQLKSKAVMWEMDHPLGRGLSAAMFPLFRHKRNPYHQGPIVVQPVPVPSSADSQDRSSEDQGDESDSSQEPDHEQVVQPGPSSNEPAVTPSPRDRTRTLPSTPRQTETRSTRSRTARARQ
jgi:hypothetical protein